MSFSCEFITFICFLLGSWLGHFSVRFYWLKAKEHQFLNETLDAVDCYEIAREFLQDVEKECSNKDEGLIIFL